MKNKKFALAIKILLLFLLAPACIHYNTLTLNENSKESVGLVSEYKNLVLVHDQNGQGQFRLDDLKVTDDSIFGTLVDFSQQVYRLHNAHQESFRKNKNVKKSNIDPLLVMHIYMKKGNLETGGFGEDLTNIDVVEIHETATGKSSVASFFGGIVLPAAIGAGIFTIALIIACGCPYVETVGDTNSSFNGSMFPGSIFKSLEREDYLELEDALVRKDGTVVVRVSNNLPEVHYIDQLQLIGVESNGYKNVVFHNESFLGYQNTQKPQKAIAGNGLNVTNTLAEQDAESYKFDNLNQTEELNSLELWFDKDEIDSNPKLTFVAKQSEWLDAVANFLFLNIGNRYDEWIAKKDEDAGKWMLNNRKNGVSLNVMMENNGKWERVGYLDNIGTLDFRKVVLDLDLSNHTDSNIHIKLESAYKIWEIDQVALSDEYSENLISKPHIWQNAINQDKEDVTELIATSDRKYYEQDSIGMSVLLVAQPEVTKLSRLFLKGVGYYHHKVESDNDPNFELIKSMKHDLAMHEMSKTLEFSLKLYARSKTTVINSN